MKRIVCHGDSLTLGADLDDACRWPALVSHAIGEKVVNTGIGGDTTAGMLAGLHPNFSLKTGYTQTDSATGAWQRR